MTSTSSGFRKETYANGSSAYLAFVEEKTPWFFGLLSDTETRWVVPSRQGYRLQTVTVLANEFIARFPTIEAAQAALRDILDYEKEMEGRRVVKVEIIESE